MAGALRPSVLLSIFASLLFIVTGSLDAAGVRWAIATSSRREQVASSVAALGLQRAPLVVDGSNVSRAKPAPDLLLLAARELGVAPGDAWYVGDSTWDMLAAVAAGMRPIGVTSGSADRDTLSAAGASSIVGTLAELVSAFWMDPATGQFLSVDPEVASTLQPYAYAAGNPVSETDPTGMVSARGTAPDVPYLATRSATPSVAARARSDSRYSSPAVSSTFGCVCPSTT